eukprot:TRINITY_DN4738_c0_g1_i1.p1 TRINITY_DN4738_c0_g1~~TRINITY_DN4738_c0_g1_i1.p1  ORF type:complete len:310 (+),score=31.23 TRINITY_DN4738_c0_g1_i1:227-1156(+)
MAVSPGALGRDYVPTTQEKQVLDECKQASISRGAILAIGGLGLTHFLLRRRSRPLSNLLAFATYSGAGLTSFYAGVVSYQPQCVDKILALHNSPMADELRMYMKRMENAPGTTTPNPPRDEWSHRDPFKVPNASNNGDAQPSQSSSSPYGHQLQQSIQPRYDSSPSQAYPRQSTVGSRQPTVSESAPDAFAPHDYEYSDADSAPAPPSSYSDLRNQHRAAQPAPTVLYQPRNRYQEQRQQQQQQQHPDDQDGHTSPYQRQSPPSPARSYPSSYRSTTGYGDHTPRPTSALDAQRTNVPRYNQYGDPIDE